MEGIDFKNIMLYDLAAHPVIEILANGFIVRAHFSVERREKQDSRLPRDAAAVSTIQMKKKTKRPGR